MDRVIHGVCSIEIKDFDPKTGKPYLQVTWPDDSVVCFTANLGDMIAGAARGALLRWQDQQGRKKQ